MQKNMQNMQNIQNIYKKYAKNMKNICKIEECHSLVGSITELHAIGRQLEP